MKNNKVQNAPCMGDLVAVTKCKATDKRQRVGLSSIAEDRRLIDRDMYRDLGSDESGSGLVAAPAIAKCK